MTPEMRSPIVHPTVTIDGRVLVVKCSLHAQYLLSQRGINAAAYILKAATKDPHGVACMMDLFAACVAENYLKAREIPPTAEQWASTISDEQWAEVCASVSAAMVKVLRPVTPAPAAAALQAPPEVQEAKVQ